MNSKLEKEVEVNASLSQQHAAPGLIAPKSVRQRIVLLHAREHLITQGALLIADTL